MITFQQIEAEIEAKKKRLKFSHMLTDWEQRYIMTKFKCKKSYLADIKKEDEGLLKMNRRLGGLLQSPTTVRERESRLARVQTMINEVDSMIFTTQYHQERAGIVAKEVVRLERDTNQVIRGFKSFVQ